MPEWMRQLLSSEYFVPQGHSYLWKPGMLTLHALANVVIALSCFAIAFTLLRAVRRHPPLARFPRLAGVAFFVTIGLTHILAVVVLWNPIYWVEGGLRALAALAAVVTAASLPRLLRAQPNRTKNA
ncbi:MAG TPA: hypothetical protein VFH73_19235 [Polyangia bacterium]|jgi:hypothetical protein|nr:hypothetical protein [Polyangia bacterium]